VNRTNGTFSRSKRDPATAPLLVAEAFILSRIEKPLTLNDLVAGAGGSAAETYGAIYALSLAGLVDRNNWPQGLLVKSAKASAAVPNVERSTKPVSVPREAADETSELNAFFSRVANAEDNYEVLDVGRVADTEEIKRAYRLLARRFHPDRFHQREPELRQRVESAFARIAQAYETLSDESLRADYDGKLKTRPPAPPEEKKAAPPVEKSQPRTEYIAPKSANAESSFQRGLAAMQQNQREFGLRLLAEAAMLQPRTARYRAHYGHALITESGARRIAETELQAAISLEPNNAAFRVMLAELYKQLGLRRRAEGELERALVVDPKNEAARTLLASLKKI